MLKFRNLSNYSLINHFVTTRNGGCSSKNYESLNLSFKVGDTTENVNENRLCVSKHLGVLPEHLYFPDQCHTSNVKIIRGSNAIDFSKTDAIITNRTGIGIGVLAADCVPVLFFDPVNNVIAAAHAGWRGTVAKITEKVIHAMQINFGSDVSAIQVGIGPAISQKNYEVGEEVKAEVDKIVPEPGAFFKPSPQKNHYFLDLHALNRKLLLDCRLDANNIEMMELCTFKRTDLFFSARRDGFSTGRFGAVIGLRNN